MYRPLNFIIYTKLHHTKLHHIDKIEFALVPYRELYELYELPLAKEQKSHLKYLKVSSQKNYEGQTDLDFKIKSTVKVE